jgi:uncharacterized membrane protein
VIIVLSLAGLADALYFTFAYYGGVRRARWVPEALCAHESSNCLAVVKTPYARVFGVPNSLLGVLYYLLLIAWAIGRQFLALEFRSYLIIFGDLLLGVSAVTVVLGFYLIYALRRVLRTSCPLCYAAHAINVALAAVLIIAGQIR